MKSFKLLFAITIFASSPLTHSINNKQKCLIGCTKYLKNVKKIIKNNETNGDLSLGGEYYNGIGIVVDLFNLTFIKPIFRKKQPSALKSGFSNTTLPKKKTN